MRIERAYSKDKILELYLNEIYLGLGAYGIAAASLVYFDKSVQRTDGRGGGLSRRACRRRRRRCNPLRNHDRAIERRNYVIDRLLENGWIKQADADKARKEPLDVTNRGQRRAYFRRRIFRRGSPPRHVRALRREEALRRRPVGSHHARSEDAGDGAQDHGRPASSIMTRRRAGAAPISKIDISGDWGVKLADVKSLSDISPWRMAVVLETSDQSARIGFQPGRELGGAVLKDRETGIITLEGVKWAKAGGRARRRQDPDAVIQVLSPGDVDLCRSAVGKDGSVEGQYRLRQLPEVSGAMVVMDPQTGRVLAMVGGFSFDQSQFNRATQAYGSRARRSSRSSIPRRSTTAIRRRPSWSTRRSKSIRGRAAASGVRRTTAASIYGPTTLALTRCEQSLNTVTVRLAQDIGMPLIGEYAKRFGVYDELPNYLSYALGAGETTVMRMVTAYSMFDNGGRRVKPTLIDRIQDRYGHTIFKHDTRECRRLRRARRLEEPARAAADRPPRAGARSDDGLSDHLDDGRRGAARHRDRGAGKSASRSPARPAPPTTRRTPGSSASRRTSSSASISATTSRAISAGNAHRRPSGRADRQGFPEARARRQAGDSVPGAGRDQADPRRCQDRHARRPGRYRTSSSKPSSPAPRRRIIIR